MAMFGLALFGVQCAIIFLYEPGYPIYFIPASFMPAFLAIIISIIVFASTKVPYHVEYTRVNIPL